MPTTPFLGIQQVSANQSQKEVTINDAILALEAASCGTLVVPFTSGLTQTLSVEQFTGFFLFTPTVATADAVLQVPHAVNGNPTERLFGVRNKSGHGITVRSDTTGGEVVVIPDGEARLLAIADNDVFIAAEPGVAVAFIGLSDVPHAYTDKGGQALVATMAEDGLEFVALVKNLDNLTDVDTTTSAPSAGQVLTYVSGVWKPANLPASATSLLALTDTPDDYSGAANKFLRVNGAANGIEFISILQVSTGGTEGQVLTKGSGSAYGWADATGSGSGVPDGGTAGQVLAKLSNTDGDADWVDPTGGSGDGGLYRFGGFFTTTPIASEVLVLHSVTDPFILPENLDGSSISVATNPASSWVAFLTKNGSTIGTITISTSGVVTIVSDAASIAIDDVLAIVAPVTPDGTIAGGSFTIRGAGDFGGGVVSSRVKPTIVQRAPGVRINATSGTLNLASVPTAGNMLLVMLSGFTGGGHALTFATGTNKFNEITTMSSGNQCVRVFAAIAQGNSDDQVFNISNSDRAQWIGYELEGAESISFQSGGQYLDTSWEMLATASPVDNALHFIAFEQDGGDFYTVPSPPTGVTAEYVPASDGQNHQGIFLLAEPDFFGIISGTISGAQTVFKAEIFVAGGSVGSPPVSTESMIIALGDETTALTTGAAKVTIRMPYAFTVTAVRASLTTSSSSGLVTVDINESGVSILSTSLSIDSGEKTSTTATTPAVISDNYLADDAEITFDIDAAGTGAAGLKVYLIGHK